MSERITSLIPTALVPSGVKDDRQHALAQLFGEALAKIDLSALIMSDPMMVDARLLPFMIREFGAQEFIDPEFPVHVQRRILKGIWKLKSLHGYDAGVKLGLELLGMKAEITHWHEVSPAGEPNTHTIEFLVGEQLFSPNEPLLGGRYLLAAKRMIQATKRCSQTSYTNIGLRTSGRFGVVPFMRSYLISTGTHCTQLRIRSSRTIGRFRSAFTALHTQSARIKNTRTIRVFAVSGNIGIASGLRITSILRARHQPIVAVRYIRVTARATQAMRAEFINHARLTQTPQEKANV